ncbi:MAG TPA: Lrp/AsnC family transcriptional regulator [Patescibacteria group bacterium]|nr:Lrp/AsnC family transcriptional regulator [Patescibacteria group bacterium]
MKLKTIDYGLLSELIKNPKSSDRQVAKKMGISQPTVTRRRTELEKERLLDYTAVPDLKKLGFEILAITFGNRAAHPQHAELQIQKAKDFIERHPNLIFVSSGLGFRFDRVAISVHRNYNDYSKFQQEIRQEWGDAMTVAGSFMISLVSDSILRNLTFKHLAELMKREQSKNREN